ncbi:MAG TPA: hypothetical protein PKO36_01160 [Candidatus Hydrogenedentes bacterium]|nr:hypothetical protein [Candidatus Hydrogenedentota bacterium]HOT49915.1 hypothetical protein [Candidatus Hydrogenedentota bacterium]HOV74769.1 hypothetical protein [Candidatus Hydrogenedentota bacterium]HPC17764.1 hypothetical protein [Candidatus Hydrogenedentota bacterium]HRT21575.1 hypothetical protein [Candidatus Hydrogenedentota bacterium]
MQIQTFVGKVSIEGLKQLDEHINEWIVKNKIEPKQIHQQFGYERHHHMTEEEPVLIVSVWH